MQPASSSNITAGSTPPTAPEEREAIVNPPRRKRRRMATGHGVQQIPETSTVLLPPQQQEQPTLPPIEQRLVAEHQAAATASFVGAEVTETDRPEPAAAFAEAPAADEPMAIEVGPAAEEIPLEDIIANFSPHHQEKIRECLNDEDVQRILNEVRNFLTLLRESGIKLSPGQGRIPTPSLFGRLRYLTLPKDAVLVQKFFEKASIFFSAVNPAQTKNTGCLSTMLDTNIHITNFANETEDNLRLLADNPYLKQITSMCHRKGVPDPVKAAEIIEWDCWKVDGTFSFELFRAFSSMRGGRGLINDQAQVVAMLAWDCWQLDGEFSMELLRTVSSMMNRRGFPDQDTLTAMLAWECWKIDGEFSIEFLRIFSSMMNGCGIPQKEKVEAILAWPCWQIDGKFSFELLRTFSSMSHGRGLIKQAEVERILAWPCWQGNGKFSLDLLRTFSSMSSSRGLLKDEARITAILAWECWKKEGEFSVELLRTVASMMSGRGLVEKGPTENFLSWPCWQVDGKYNIELLRIFSSMMNGCGIPQKEKVEAILAWPCWQIDGKFSFDLLRTFSSMSHGRGLIKQAEVERVLAWPCWQVNGKFSLDLLRIFSSMSHSRGLLKDEARINAILAWGCWKIEGEFSIKLLRTVASMLRSRGLPGKELAENLLSWPCWQVDGKFSFDLLQTFSSMSHGRGLIKQAEVERVLAWPCWQVDGKFSLRLLGMFSSMMNGRGIPEQAEVEALLAWPCWQVDGKVSIDRLHIFAVMMQSRGMPDQATAEAFLAWLPLRTETSDKGQVYLRSAYRAFVSTSIPDPKVLANIEAALRPYFTEDITSDDEYSSDSEDELSEIGQLKALTLFCAASAEWQKNLCEIQQFLAAYNTTSCSQTVMSAIVDSLLQIFAHHRQAGVRLWLEHHSRQPGSRGRLTEALSISAPLVLAKFALKQLPESEWQDYIALCKNLLPRPDKKQWQALKPLRDLLNERFSLTLSKRTMLEILWSHSDNNHPRYLEKINALLKIVPATAQLIRLQQAFGQKKMQAFLDACLTWHNAVQQSANPALVPELKIQELLLEGLLVANHYLSDHRPIPQLCFSKQTAGNDGQSVIIDGDINMTGQQRLWHFVAAMLMELEQTEYQFKRQQIKILPPDSDPVVLPKPKFACPNGGSFVITNWTPEQLAAFFRATEFTEHWYKPPQDKRDLRSRRLEEKLRQMQKARATQTPQPGHKRALLLSPTVIAIILRRGDRLKEAVWSSLEHYAKNGQLSDGLCRMLAPVIQLEPPGTVPEIVRTTVTARIGQIDMSNMPIVEIPSSSSASPFVATSPAAAASAIQPAHATFEIAVQELERFHVLEREELEMLAPWRDRMTYTQLKNVIDKMNLDKVDPETGLAWRIAFESKAGEHFDSSLDELLEPSPERADD